jgi:peptide-methionine (S)-S-oxide reductase
VSIFSRRPSTLPSADEALPGRDVRPFAVGDRHVVLDAPVITDEVPEGYQVALFGLGCFWGAEEIYWQVPGVWSTSVGYAGGITPNPTYEEVCTGRTGHTEAVRVVYDPARVAYADLVKIFFEVHDPTQGMRQGNDVGTQYRSAIYYADEAQRQAAEEAREAYALRLHAAGYGEVTTEIAPAGPFYYAEDYHQQYLAKNPDGYCGLGGTGVSCPVGRFAPEQAGPAT